MKLIKREIKNLMHDNRNLTLLDRLDLLDRFVNELWNRTDITQNDLILAYQTYKRYANRYQYRDF